jgi:hypothetical protein
MRTKWAWTITLAATAALSAGTALPAGAATTPGWRVTQTYAADSALLESVTTSASDAWAIGLSAPLTLSAGIKQAGSLRPAERLAQAERLRQILRQGGAEAAASSTDDVSMMVRHYNGHTWQTIPAPSGIGADEYVAGDSIAATSGSDAWLMGMEISGNTEATKVEHWNGTKWNAVDSFQNSYPSTIVAVNAKDYWAFGSEIFAQTNVAWHYTGTTWVTTPIDMAVTSAVVFKGTVWIIGESRTTGDLQAQYLSGTTWVTAKLPSVALTSDEQLDLDAATSDGSGKLTLAAEVDNENTGETVKSLLFEYNGKTWNTVTIPTTVLGDDEVYSVAPDGDGGLWLAASVDTSILIHDTKAGKWTKQAAPLAKGDATFVSLNWIPGGTSLWGIGEEGPASEETSQAVILKYGN